MKSSEKHIVITSISDTRNNGCWKMIIAAIDSIRSISPVPVKFTLISNNPQIEKDRINRADINVISGPWTKVSIRRLCIIWQILCFILIPIQAALDRVLPCKKMIFPEFWQSIGTADLILDLGGDSYSTAYSNYSLMTLSIPIVTARILNKPYMFCAQSIGPLGKGFIHKLLIGLLRDASAITTRERITDRVLANLEISDNVTPLQDLAFLVKPSSPEEIDKICLAENIDTTMNLVGISISGLISKYAFKELPLDKRREEYLQAMALFSDDIIERHRKNILFIPHVTIPGGSNDRDISIQVKKRMRHSEQAIVLQGDYTGAELKGLIGLCEFFIGSRMHATIGALTQGVPTITYVYNHKTVGINGEIFRQEDYLIDIRAIAPNQLLPLSIEFFDKLVANKDKVRKHLLAINPELKRKDANYK